MRIDGFIHNLVSVLLLPGVPISVIGLLALPWQARGRALRPLVLVSAVTFTVTTLLFPVSTTWGTFLHAAGPVQVLLVIAALLALDAGIARLGAWRGWTRPVAWLGALLGVFASALFSVVLLPTFGDGSRRPRRATTSSASGWPRSVIRLTPPPARSSRTSRSGWPRPNASRRSPCRTRRRRDVLDLAAAFPGTHLMVLSGSVGRWPADPRWRRGDDDCFHELDLGPGPAGAPDPIAGTRAFEIVCP